MYNGDRSRKETLVQYGFRLPSALDNRPLKFQEFDQRVKQVIYVSATPGPYEVEKAELVTEQIIRPTGLIDPEILVRPATNQVDDLLGWIKGRVATDERVLVTTLTKSMAEDLTDYYADLGLKVRYLHSTSKPLKGWKSSGICAWVSLMSGGDQPAPRRLGLTRGLLVAVSMRIRKVSPLGALAHPNVRPSGQEHSRPGHSLCRSDHGLHGPCHEESNRRRKIQLEYNKKHHITPVSIQKAVDDILASPMRRTTSRSL